MKHLTLILLIALLAGCGTMPDVETAPAISDDEMQMVETARALGVDLADKAILSCTVEMIQGGYFRRYHWRASETSPTNPVVAYEVEAAYDVGDTTSLMIPADKTNFRMRVRAVGENGNVSEWSEWSDTINQ